MRRTTDPRAVRRSEITRAVALLAASALLGWFGCSSPSSEELLGLAQVAITNVPGDGSVACIRITAAGDVTVAKLLDVTPGESAVFSLGGLPVGTTAFTGDAFPSICAVVSVGTVPTWVSDVVVVSVNTSFPVTVDLLMHRNGHANVGVSFDDAGCRSNGVPCLLGGECCAGQCASGACCTPLGDPCAANIDCCTGLCNAGICQELSGCTPNGAACLVDADCCGSSCSAGVCQLPPSCQPAGGACSVAADCCVGNCVAGQCKSASCSDGIQNQGEVGVDCGGPCVPCPSCSDGIQNQGEVGVDCGGPCVPCPSCSDGIQNQGEVGVDCGGPCAPCPSCSDGMQNQGEVGVDCGGPCVPCPSCSDGMQNQGEVGVDCGGPCVPCPPICVNIVRGSPYVVADASIQAGQPAKNFGSSTRLFLSPGVQVLMQFDLSGIPAGVTLASATLKVFALSGFGGVVKIHNVLAPWIETGVTYTSFAVAFSPLVLATYDATPGLHEIDVTPQVQAWVGGFTANHGFLFESLSVSQLSSSEAAIDRPALVVCY